VFFVRRHPESEPLIDRLPKTIDCFNIILGEGREVYTGVEDTRGIARPAYYTKKITLTTEKHTYGYRMSDIHYEIDMGFLGCNAKLCGTTLYPR
jgi:hypothetical protein